MSGCDTLVAQHGATERGATIFAKNSDRPPAECQPLILVERATHAQGAEVACQYISIPQARETARVLGSRPVWLWGFEHGVNEHGVAIGNETIFAREAPASTGLIGMDLVRLGLERATSAEAALEVMTRLIETHGQGGSGFPDVDWPYNNGFLIADPGEAWILEAAGKHWAARRCGATDSISNQISIGSDWEKLSPLAIDHAHEQGWATGERFDFGAAFRDLEAVPGVMSEGRLRRSRALLSSGRGRLTLGLMQEMLRDHGESGRRFRFSATADQEQFYTICMHQGPSRTAASMVSELGKGRRGPQPARVSFGRPCTSVFVPVFVAGKLPLELTTGSQAPGDALWWVFERLSERAEPDAEALDRIRTTFDDLETKLAREAEAAERALAGLPELQADRVATEAMRTIVQQVVSAAHELARACGV